MLKTSNCIKIIYQIKAKAKNARINCIKMISKAGSGHPGGSLSIIDLLIVLFIYKIKRSIKNSQNKNRDRFLLSKGHGVPALYSIFVEIGLLRESDLFSLRCMGSKLQGHPDVIKFPEVEASTGSLGQGLSIAQGMAIAYKIEGLSEKIYCMLGDGEMQEGQIWEALMSAPKFKLNNLCVILDYNKSQIDGYIDEVMNINPLKDKLLAFNWNVIEIDGHDIQSIINAYNEFDQCFDKPTLIIAHTIKGKGVSFMEGNIDWHGKAPNEKETKLAIKELMETG